ncbi:MAG: serine hydroxymethyltransferase [Candidatus Sungbacteria bacterium]|nr:serine hydroxymethyltransferase [Candidatus Sungbacteria bacterium]
MNIYLKKSDPHIAKLVAAETKRQSETLDLIPSENIVSDAVLEAVGSVLINKYSEGYPRKRYYAGNGVADDVEMLCQERAKKLFELGDEWSVNVQALSGSPANMAVYFALLKPGDTVMGMALSSGGHLTHGSPVNFSGKLFRIVSYDVTAKGFLDYDQIRKIARKEKPKMIIAGATAYPRIIDFEKFADIAREVGAFLIVDMAHIAGLVASGSHPSPFSAKGARLRNGQEQVLADVVTTTTHKTLRGPRGALIFSRNDRMIMSKNKAGAKVSISRAIDSAVFPGLQGGPHDNQTAAIAVCLSEAMKPTFKTYGKQIVKNAKALAQHLRKLRFKLVSGGTDNHLMLIDLTNMGLTGKQAQDKLEQAGIIVNRNTIPHDTRSPFDPSGIRIGTPSLTTRGMKEKEMKIVAQLIYETLAKSNLSGTRKSIGALCRKFPIV